MGEKYYNHDLKNFGDCSPHEYDAQFQQWIQWDNIAGYSVIGGLRNDTAIAGKACGQIIAGAHQGCDKVKAALASSSHGGHGDRLVFRGNLAFKGQLLLLRAFVLHSGIAYVAVGPWPATLFQRGCVFH